MMVGVHTLAWSDILHHFLLGFPRDRYERNALFGDLTGKLHPDSRQRGQFGCFSTYQEITRNETSRPRDYTPISGMKRSRDDWRVETKGRTALRRVTFRCQIPNDSIPIF